MNKPHDRSKQLYDDVIRQINRRELLPGEMLMSENQFCDRYGVSRQTVRRVLEKICRLGLIEKRPGIGTFVSGASGNEPDCPRECRVGVDTPINAPHHYSRDLLEAMNSLPGGNMHFYFHFLNSAAIENGDLPESLDVLLITAQPHISDALRRRAQERNIRLILINRVSSDPAVSYIGIDHRREAEFATSYLLERGHQDILMVTYHDAASQLRAEGWRDAYRNHGMPVPENLCLAAKMNYPHFEDIQSVLEPQCFTAIFFSNNYMYYQFTQSIRQNNSSLEPFELLCFDAPNEFYCSREYTCSYVRMPFEDMARKVVEYISHAPSTPVRLFLPCDLVIQRKNHNNPSN